MDCKTAQPLHPNLKKCNFYESNFQFENKPNWTCLMLRSQTSQQDKDISDVRNQQLSSTDRHEIEITTLALTPTFSMLLQNSRTILATEPAMRLIFCTSSRSARNSRCWSSWKCFVTIRATYHTTLHHTGGRRLTSDTACTQYSNGHTSLLTGLHKCLYLLT